MTDASAGSPSRLPPHLRDFIDTQEWTFAKTMPEWPHEYIVRDRVDARLFEKLVHHIRQHGQEQRFYHGVLVRSCVIRGCDTRASAINFEMRGVRPRSRSRRTLLRLLHGHGVLPKRKKRKKRNPLMWLPVTLFATAESVR